jgi:hypothetical protein
MATASLEHSSTKKQSKKAAPTISLENFDPYNVVPPLLTSPRSLEACRRNGVKPEELVYRCLSQSTLP